MREATLAGSFLLHQVEKEVKSFQSWDIHLKKVPQ